MLEMFALTLGLFVAFIVFVILMVAVNEDNIGLSATMMVLLLGGFTVYNGVSDTITWITTNWLYTIAGVVGYLALGIGWSFFKWDRYISERIEELKNAWDKYSDPDSGFKKKVGTFTEYVKDSGSVPPASDRKSTIATWIFYWPISIVLYVLGDFLREFVNWVVKFFGNIYNAITNRHINKYK